MNKQERIGAMLQILEETEARFFQECERFGGHLMQHHEAIFVVLPELIDAQDELGTLRRLCKHNKKESALVVRLNWEDAKRVQKAVFDILESTRMYCG